MESTSVVRSSPPRSYSPSCAAAGGQSSLSHVAVANRAAPDEYVQVVPKRQEAW
jgi:hypothetical protein